jgi:catechol-2,3-dioxygenase
MEIQKLQLYTSKLSEQREFYEKELGLSVIETSPQAFQVTIGTTALTFQASEDRMYYHFAINIPSYQIKEAKEWISKLTKILPFHGNEIVDFKNWNAEALYFYDPAGNIVEFIARKNLNIVTNQPFSSKSFLHISEIGLPVKDVQNAFDLLNQQCNLQKFSGDFEKFCAIGSETGLFITIDYKQKDWIPCDDPAFPFPFEMSFEYNQITYKAIYKEEKLSIV